MNYIFSILSALANFPAFALLISIPYILWQYNKYGSINFYKAALAYMFSFYCLTVFFLINYPFPKASDVATWTTPYTQLVPFHFVGEIIIHTEFNLFHPTTWISALTNIYVLQVVFNFFMLIPFGMFLRYMFQLNAKKAWIFSLLATLFCELTQLSGLYGLYPRPYRLFDVDDLIMNGTGSMLGYWICGKLHFLPDYNRCKEIALKNGKTSISMFRRFTSLIFDYSAAILLVKIIELFFKQMNHLLFQDIELLNIVIADMIGFGFYLLILPCITNGYTLGSYLVRIKLVTESSKKLTPIILFVRYTTILVSGYLIPILLLTVALTYIEKPLNLYLFLSILAIVIWFVLLLIIYLRRGDQRAFHDIISNTKLENMLIERNSNNHS